MHINSCVLAGGAQRHSVVRAFVPKRSVKPVHISACERVVRVCASASVCVSARYALNLLVHSNRRTCVRAESLR